ncbi:hypothetical protein [Marinobacterium aestuariivivens]|uniref:HEAT repeat domain-containing protein n=1 Tax=Marinobacterium aestuariivivens TaxID=1698799 RepID=A0ABW1ZUZ7_9GAMM
MYIDLVTGSARKRRSSARDGYIRDIWDLLGYAAVIALAFYLWPAQEASPEIEREIERGQVVESQLESRVQSTRSDLRARMAAKIALREGNENRSPSDPAKPGTRSEYGSSEAENAIERLEQFRQRPDWSILPSDIANIQRDFSALFEQGHGAIPAIRHFLRTASDIDFTSNGLDEELGYATLRLALFDILSRIDDSAAEAIWFEELRAIHSPVEIETLGRYLEDHAPGLYQRDIVLSAREALSQAATQGAKGRDIAPLFKILQEYGDASLVPELEQLPEMWWGQYAAVTLASLPGGTGLSSLRYRLAQDSPRTNLGARFALQMLAQSADQPEAQAALLDTVRQNQVPDALWREIAWMIAGTYQVQLNNPNADMPNRYQSSTPTAIHSVNKFISFGPGGDQVLFGVRYARPQLSDEQMVPRLELIDTLLSETESPAARQALEQAFDTVWSSYNEGEQW